MSGNSEKMNWWMKFYEFINEFEHARDIIPIPRGEVPVVVKDQAGKLMSVKSIVVEKSQEGTHTVVIEVEELESPKTVSSQKVLENRLRRKADRRGWRLEKNRRRDPQSIDYGTFFLIDQTGSRMDIGPLTLDEVSGEVG